MALPVKVYVTVGKHIDASAQALDVIGDTFGTPNADHVALLDAAKALEAAGCYVRRALAKLDS